MFGSYKTFIFDEFEAILHETKNVPFILNFLIECIDIKKHANSRFSFNCIFNCYLLTFEVGQDMRSWNFFKFPIYKLYSCRRFIKIGTIVFAWKVSKVIFAEKISIHGDE